MLKLVSPAKPSLSTEAEISATLKTLYRRRAVVDRLIRSLETYAHAEAHRLPLKLVANRGQAVAH